MKMKHLILLLNITFFCNCGGLLPNYYDIYVANNADSDLYFEFLNNTGNHINTTYPDTTISFDKEHIGSPIKAHSHVVVNIGTLPIENYFKNIPSDTLSVFFFHSDTVSRYSWEEIQQEYKVLQRYDLSIEDINLLYNKYGVPEIPYPPNERMKNMKMYPPYGE
jgi:hypothetical protein